MSNTAYYAASVEDFLVATDNDVYAQLTSPHGFPLTPEQLSAWQLQLPLLRHALAPIVSQADFPASSWIHLEFNIPRLGRRVDSVLVTPTCVLPIEFKVGAKTFARNDYEQAWDYGLDLKNFHAPSRFVGIFPILCATEGPRGDLRWQPPHADGVRKPFCCNGDSLGSAIELALRTPSSRVGNANSGGGKGIDREQLIDPSKWGEGAYCPTPTIIEGARSLYARHTVHDIIRTEASATNLTLTNDFIEGVIADAKNRRRKAIMFVTGVPGAGKTLVGLNIATRHGQKEDDTHAVFLSGNGPLVAVLREALARDEYERLRPADPDIRKKTCREKVEVFIQNVHHFRDDTLRTHDAPVDRVVVFDEAQRAWNAQQLASFMKRRKKISGFTKTEPDVLLSAMDRHTDWAVVLCLVGGGQEINTGEAGISAWLDSMRTLYKDWDVYISPGLKDPDYRAEVALQQLISARSQDARPLPVLKPALHLATSIRSFRAEKLSHFVKLALDGKAEEGRAVFDELCDKYPIVLTRSMRLARRWIRRQRRGSERAGLMASSSAQRLKPHAIDIRVDINPVHWFLASPGDTRASTFLEDAATEFQVQGLELDWTVVTWDADLRWAGDSWSYHCFRGAKWTAVQKLERQQYLKNAYRVLLTRARQGMVIFVPPGAKRDRTRNPQFYEGVYEYLKSLGVPEV